MHECKHNLYDMNDIVVDKVHFFLVRNWHLLDEDIELFFQVFLEFLDVGLSVQLVQ